MDCILMIAFIVLSVNNYLMPHLLEKSQNLPQLELETRLKVTSFCRSKDDKVTVKILLELQYSNNSDLPIILYKNSNDIIRVRVFDRSSPNPLIDFTQTYVKSGTPLMINDAFPSKYFVSVLPKQEHVTEGELLLQLKIDSDAKSFVELKPAIYDLQITVATWPDINIKEVDLRRKWASNGYLWSDSVISKNTLLEIKKLADIEECQN